MVHAQGRDPVFEPPKSRVEIMPPSGSKLSLQRRSRLMPADGVLPGAQLRKAAHWICAGALDSCHARHPGSLPRPNGGSTGHERMSGAAEQPMRAFLQMTVALLLGMTSAWAGDAKSKAGMGPIQSSPSMSFMASDCRAKKRVVKPEWQACATDTDCLVVRGKQGERVAFHRDFESNVRAEIDRQCSPSSTAMPLKDSLKPTFAARCVHKLCVVRQAGAAGLPSPGELQLAPTSTSR